MLLKAPIATSTDDETCVEFFSRALGICLDEHESCHGDEKDRWLSTRLLDLQPSSSTKGAIRVVQTDCLPDINRLNSVQYLTLSHTWGQFSPTKLTISNMREMEEGIKFDHLPRRFQDTVLVARRLSIRFLWIDSLW